ncbi:MAG: 2-dehydropantoate 2-reductase N-terminal domain-containing protein [Nocardioidaceae bacterium]
MRILVYGAGNMGSLYAALLGRSGQDVTILARGRRLADIREHGLRLEPALGGAPTDVVVDVVARLGGDDAYDLVLVALPRDEVTNVLGILGASRRTPSVMFFGNNAAGPAAMVEALGRDRVLLGFPGAAAVRHEGRLGYLITSAREQPTTIGELDGSTSPRIRALAQAVEAAGFPTAICADMDAWLKTHVAEISPTACALYAAGTDSARLARTRDAQVMMLRAIREGYRALAALGVPVTPGSHRIVTWIPEPVLLALIRRRLVSREARFMAGHAADARAEMKVLAEDFHALVASSDVSTPALDRLVTHLDPSADGLPDGSARLALRWGGVWGLGAGLMAAVSLTLRVIRTRTRPGDGE